MLLSISGASEPLCVGGFWESWVHSVDRRGCVDWDRGGGINEGRGAGGKTGKGGEDGDGWVGEYVRVREMLRMLSSVGSSPTRSPPAGRQRISKYAIVTCKYCTVCSIPEAASNTVWVPSYSPTSTSKNILNNCPNWIRKMWLNESRSKNI